MSLILDASLATSYKSASQQARVMTEPWVAQYLFCPNCGDELVSFKANTKAKDFYCVSCLEEYQLKSSKKSMRSIISGADCDTFVACIKSRKQPSLILLRYENVSSQKRVKEIFAIPRKYIRLEMVQRRKPLPPGTKREGWVGCNIDIRTIPESHRVWFYKDGISLLKEHVISAWHKALHKKSHKQKTISPWTEDVWECVKQLPTENFFLKDIYAFETILSQKHPDNKHVRDKIRQQLQVLRDVGRIGFKGKGMYTRLENVSKQTPATRRVRDASLRGGHECLSRVRARVSSRRLANCFADFLEPIRGST